MQTPKRPQFTYSPERAAQTILRHLEDVDAQRRRRAAEPALDRWVQAVKRYQQQRFALTHADLLQDRRYSAAARFFLAELYGPQDFTRRDAQFARIVPALVKLFPATIVSTVVTLSELHSLSESLDSAMAERLSGLELRASLYVEAWRQTGRPKDRARQVSLTVEVGQALGRYTRMPMLMTSLRLMRGPARRAGLSELQGFLEQGFQTFRSLDGGDEFLLTVEQRERALLERLSTPRQDEDWAGQLP